jgi:hypothetical protein
MLIGAEKYRAEDEKQKQAISARDALEFYCANMRWDIQHNLKDIVSESDKTTVLLSSFPFTCLNPEMLRIKLPHMLLPHQRRDAR